MTMEISVGDDKDLKQVWGLLMKGSMFLLCIAAFLGGCSYFNAQFKMKDDHPIEELIEDLVEFHLGLPEDSLDFSPNE